MADTPLREYAPAARKPHLHWSFYQHVPQSSLIVCPRPLSLGRCCGTDCDPNGFDQGAHDIGCPSKVRRQARGA